MPRAHSAIGCRAPPGYAKGFNLIDPFPSTISMPSTSLFKTKDGKNYLFPFLLVTSLFFIWAVCNGMIDTMDKHFQGELHLSKAQSAWVQFAHYLGYFLMSLPAGWLARKLGYKGGIVAGLLVVAAGGFWFIPATHINAAAHAGVVSLTTAFVGYLFGVCVIATGLTFLETIANPYATVLGPKEYGAARINWAQSANGAGWVVGPQIGAVFFYAKDAMGKSTGSDTLYIPYVTIAVICVVLAVVFSRAKLPEIRSEDDFSADQPSPGRMPSIWSRPHFVWAVVAQFFYVAAQAGIFSFFINYMTSEVPPISPSLKAMLPASWFEIGGSGAIRLSDQGAASLSSLAFLCFLAGRISGALILKRIAAHRVLGLYGLLNVAICLLVFLKLGWLSVGCVFLSYFFMSIMFPTIFALGLFQLGAQTKKASAFIVMAIMGGAILPKLMGYVADRFDMSDGFMVPLGCFAIISFYGFNWPKFARSQRSAAEIGADAR
jgi:FHS family L-fucose permease-like MFS transporter